MNKQIKEVVSFRSAEKSLHDALIRATDGGVYDKSFIIKEALREYLVKHNYLKK